jgi:hypothetical protein
LLLAYNLYDLDLLSMDDAYTDVRLGSKFVAYIEKRNLKDILRCARLNQPSLTSVYASSMLSKSRSYRLYASNKGMVFN